MIELVALKAIGLLFVTALVVTFVFLAPIAVVIGAIIHARQPAARVFVDRDAPFRARLSETDEEREARHKRMGIGAYGIRAAKSEDQRRTHGPT